MAACKSLRHIFENTIPENNSSSSLIDSLSSWKHIKTIKPPLDHSFTEIFGELHFKEKHPDNKAASPSLSSSTSSFFPPPQPPSSSSFFFPPPSFPINSVSQSSSDNYNNQHDEKNITNEGYLKPYHCRSDSFSSLNSDSLQLCTESLGSESLDDAEDLKIEAQNTWKERNKNNDGDNMGPVGSNNSNSHHNLEEKMHVRRHSTDSYCRKKRLDGRIMFPPPIPYIGQTGKPSVSFQSYRKDGRFVLKEVRVPTHECLQASREDGRLRLSFIQPNNEDDDDENADDVVEDDDGGEEEGKGKMSGFKRIEEDEEEEEERDVDSKEEDDGKS